MRGERGRSEQVGEVQTESGGLPFVLLLLEIQLPRRGVEMFHFPKRPGSSF